MRYILDIASQTTVFYHIRRGLAYTAGPGLLFFVTLLQLRPVTS